MLPAIILGLIVVFLIWDILYRKKRHDKLTKAGIGGAMPLPIIGNLLEMLGTDPSNILPMIEIFVGKYGKNFRGWIAYELVFMCQDVKYLEGILTSPHTLSKNNTYDMLEAWLGTDSLLMSKPAVWSRRRKTVLPTFHFKMLEQFVEIFDQQSAVMVKNLQKQADGVTVIDVFPRACLLALDIIAETAMGIKVNAQQNPEFPYTKALQKVLEILCDRCTKPFDRFDWYFRIFNYSSNQLLKKSLATVHGFTNKVIEERRNALQKEIAEGTYQQQSNETVELGLKKRMALLDVLLQASDEGKPLSNDAIRGEVDTFMFAGHDTTATAISFTCYLLARHPEIQQKVFEEIREVIGDDKDRPVGMPELQDLKYLECVIKESLRLFPPVPAIGRKTDRDCAINGTEFSANTNIFVLIYYACRDPECFPQPDKFIPERFSGDDKINQFAFIPFSAGSRNCIGQKFAMWEMKSTLSKILRHYELLPLGADVHLVISITLRSATGINVGLKPRAY